jgi:hypothetical protein
MTSGARPVPPGTGSFSGKVSTFGMTQSARRAPFGLVIYAQWRAAVESWSFNIGLIGPGMLCRLALQQKGDGDRVDNFRRR